MITADGQYRLRFHHETGSWMRNPMRRPKVIITRRCVCEVVTGTKEAPIVAFTDVAYCSPSDNYDAELGRQVALFKVVKALPKGSHLGALLISAYLKRKGAKPWQLTKDGHPILEGPGWRERTKWPRWLSGNATTVARPS